MMLKTWMLALGLVLVFEGIVPALFPNKWRNYLLKLAKLSVAELRNIGWFVLTIGISIIWFAH